MNEMVSFIIPAFNSERTLPLCLESIQALEYPKNKVEIIVVDNGSCDMTRDIALKFTEKVLEDPRATIGKLRNIGTKDAIGSFFAFVDSDIVLPKCWLKVALKSFEDRTIGMLGTHTYQVPDNDSWVEKAWKIHLDQTDDQAERNVAWVTTRALIVRREIFEAIGGFDQSLVTCEDVELGYRVQKKTRIVSVRNLAPLHLGGVKSLPQFFKKEVWRGQNSFGLSLQYLRNFKEILGLGVLFYYLVLFTLLLPVIIHALLARTMAYFSIICGLIMFPLIAMALYTCKKTGKYPYFGKLIVMYGIYFLARTKALLSWKK